MMAIKLPALYLFYLSLLLLNVISISWFDELSFNSENVLFLIILNLPAIILFFFRKDNQLSKNKIKHSDLIILGLIVVTFQYPIDFLIGYVTEDHSVWINKQIVIKAMLLSIIGILAFITGYSTLRKFKPKKIKELQKVSTKWLTLFSAICLFGYFYFLNPLYLTGFYGSESIGGTSTRFALLFNCFTFGIIIQKTINVKRSLGGATIFLFCKEIGFVNWLLIFSYLVSVIFSGDRGPIMTYGLLLFLSFFLTTKRVPKLSSIILMVFGIMIFGILKEVRNQNKSLSFFEKLSEVISQEGEKKSCLDSTKELAGTCRVTHATVNYIEETGDYQYGKFQLQQVLIVIPFITDKVAEILATTETRLRNSSNFNTWLIQGNNPTYGNGSSAISDLYLDFGLLGVLVGFWIFGYVIKNIEYELFIKTNPLSLFTFVFGMVYFSGAIYISRSSILYQLQFVFWIYFILSVNKKVLKLC